MLSIGLWIHLDSKYIDCVKVLCRRDPTNQRMCYTETCPGQSFSVYFAGNRTSVIISVYQDDMCISGCSDQKSLYEVGSVALMFVGVLCLLFSCCMITCMLCLKGQATVQPISVTVPAVVPVTTPVEKANVNLSPVEHGEGVCAICIDGFEQQPGIVVVVTKCNHYYHEPCISKWLENKRECPMCKELL
jgi:hypothetical protein